MLSLLILISACSPSKNTAASRHYQAFITKYNIYYNGDEHFKEQLHDMESKYEDDYTRFVMMHPAEARANPKAPQPSGDFKRSIEKAQKAIQLRSIKKKPKKKGNSQKDKDFRKREEFNPFLHNAWLMMAKSQYYNGDFLGAAATFHYIWRHFGWLPDVVTQAKIWQALSYCAIDWTYEAETILSKIKDKDLTSSNLRNLYDFTYADYLVRARMYEQALPFLQRAANAAHGAQKNRIYFLLGQVYAHLDKKSDAYKAFKKAGSGVGTDYRTKFNARIKQSEVYTGSNIKSEVNALRAMTRYQRNNEFQDQIYYAIGNLYLSRKDTTEAKKNYSLAIEKSTRNGIDKALAQLALGNILFSEQDYVKAQPCYSEAIPLLPDNFPDYKNLKRRSDVLDQLATYAGNVELQDSLLALSKLSEEEQMKVCTRLAEELKKKEKEEAEKKAQEEYLAQQQGNNANNNNDKAPQQFQMNNDKSWYFYNTMTKNAGKAEFAKRWGARKNEDDWRRRNKTSFSFDTPEDDALQNDSLPADSVSKTSKEELDKLNDPHFPEYYFKQIPRTELEIQNCNDIIQEGLYNMGLILKDQLNDYAAARIQWDKLLNRYPDNQYRLDVYYNLYLMAIRQEDLALAEHWRAMILSDFPDSNLGMAMKDPAYFDNLRRMEQVQEDIYTDAYQAFLNNDNPEVHALTARMEQEYPLSKLLPKFVFIDALSYLTQKDYDKFKERLTYLLQKWPDTDITPVAGSILTGIKQGRQLQAGSSNSRSMIWNLRLTNDTAAAKIPSDPAKFVNNPNAPHYLVLAFPIDSVNPNQILYDVARFNFSTFAVKDFDLEPMNFGRVGLLIIKGFNNQKELNHYRSLMQKPGALSLPQPVRPIIISKDNFQLLLKEGRSFEEYFQFQDNAAIRQKENDVGIEPEPDDIDNKDPGE